MSYIFFFLGTLSLQDSVTDLAGETIEFEEMGDNCHAHEGMLKAGRHCFKDIYNNQSE